MPGRGLVLIGLFGRGSRTKAKAKPEWNMKRKLCYVLSKNWLTSLNKCHDLHTVVPGTHRLGDIWDLAVWLGRPVKPHPPVVT